MVRKYCVAKGCAPVRDRPVSLGRPGTRTCAAGKGVSLRAVAVLALVLAIDLIASALALPTPALAQKQAPQKQPTHRANIFGLRDTSVVQLSITVDKARTVACDQDFAEVLVANPGIADVVALSNKQLYVLGKKAGLTSISLVGTDKRVIGLVNVEVSHDVDGLQRRLRQLVPGSDITVTSVNGKVLLTGTAPDAPALQRALLIAEQVAPQGVTNAMTIRGSQQVLLEVRFVEATRDSSRELGIGWDVIGSRIHGLAGATGAVAGFSGTAGALPVLGNLASGNTPFGVAIARLLDGGTKADVIIQALEKRGLARRLAEPNLVALSGDTASFLAGGEFPFPVQADQGRITVEFKKFGVGLAFTPTVLGEGQINLKIEPEVSEIDPTNSMRVNGIEVPGLMVRRTQTTIELRDGQSFAIAGLLYNNNYKNQSQLPWIGDVPVLGTLFRSASFQRRETDLVIIVTPRLVRPARPDERLHTPLDKRLPSNDAEFFLRGQQEVRAARPQPFHGHILDLGSGELAHRDPKAGVDHVPK